MRVFRASFPVALLLPLAAGAAAPSVKEVSAGTAWEVPRTTRLSRLTIGEGASVQAPSGKALTLTVDGASVPASPGSYRGDVVLTVTNDIPVPFGEYGPYHYRAAVYVSDGRYDPSRSVAAAAGGSVGDRLATGLKIASREENFNGIVVTGKGTYVIDGASIDLRGNGGNDFAGYGAAIMSSGDARLTVNHAHIQTEGAVRTALFIGGNSTMTVNDSDIEVFPGTLPKDYQFSIVPGKMMEVPYGLGLHGNVRATNLIDTATVYYNNVHVVAHGWGALSSDGGGPTRMFVNGSHIETVGSGYGAYANGDSHDHFAHTLFDVADYGVIIGGNGSATLTDESALKSRRIGVMMHQGSGGSVLNILRKTVVRTRLAAVEVKGRGADIYIDDADVQAGNGVLVQTMENDDPILLAMAAHASAPPAGAAPGGPPGAPPGGGMPGGEAAGYSPDVNVSLRNESLAGDIVHAMTARGDMHVMLESASLDGAISTAIARPASGHLPDEHTREAVGDVANSYVGRVGQCELSVFLDGGSKWQVRRTSFINDLTLAHGASVSAPPGMTLTLLVDGVAKAIGPGNYHGQIELRAEQAR